MQIIIVVIADLINHGITFTLGLVPCIQEKCPKWKEGEGRDGCILLVKEGKHGRI